MHNSNLQALITILMITILSISLIYVLADNSFIIREINWNTQPQYVIIYNLTRNDEAISNATGKWYPPIPPVNYLTNRPQYLIQWVLPSGLRGGLPLNITLSTNTTELYVGEYVAVTINVSSRFFAAKLSNVPVYLYDTYSNESLVEKYQLTLINGSVHTVLKLDNAGKHVLYAVFPRQGIYLQAVSNNVTINVKKYPLQLRITSDKREVKHDEPFTITVHAINTVKNTTASNINVKIYALRKGVVTYTWTGKIINGVLTLRINISEPGRYLLYAKSSEDPVYQEAISNKILILVYPDNPLSGEPVVLNNYSILVITSLMIILMVVILIRRRLK